MACRPKASGSLRSAHGRKDKLSKNNKFYIFILMILRPYVISSSFHLSLIALFRIKCNRMLWHFELSPQFTGPGAEFTQIRQEIPYRIIAKRVPPPGTSFPINTTVFDFLTSCTKLLHAHEFRHMFFAVSQYRLFCVISKS